MIRKLLCFAIMSLTIVACKQLSDLPDPLEAGWHGEKVCEILKENSEIRILKCQFPPGVGHEKHHHKPHFGYTLKGSTFKIKDANGDRTVEVPSGSSFSNDMWIEHEVLNVGDSTAIFLIVEYK